MSMIGEASASLLNQRKKESIMRCTFVNNGTGFSFLANKETQHPFRDRKVSMFEVHGEMALEAMDDGRSKQTFLLNSQGDVMDAKTIKGYIRFLRDQK